MTKLIETPKLHEDDILSMYDYVSNVDFNEILTETSKAFILNEKTKNKKEDVVGYWLAVQLRVLMKKFFPNDRITVQFLPKISGLLNKTQYEISVSLDEKTIIVISIKFIISNLSQNFQREFNEVVVNTVNVNGYKGMEYVNLTILSEETPTFTSGNEKVFEKYEQLLIKHLVKLSNLSIVKTNPCYLPTMILSKNVNVSEGQLKTQSKQIKAKPSNLKSMESMCLKYGYDELIFAKIKNNVIEQDVFNFMKKILLLVKARINPS